MPGVGNKSPGDQFTLSSADNDFNSRTNNVFASLDSIETQHATHERLRSDDRHQRSRSRSRSPDVIDHGDVGRRPRYRNRAHRDRENRDRPRSRVDDRHVHLNTFRRPSNRPPHRPYTPDFRRNPQNYTEYDLSSVADHTERNNTSAALSFLDDLRKRRESEEKTERRAQSDYETSSTKTTVWGTSSKYVRRKHAFTRPDKSCDDIADEPQPGTSSSREEIDNVKDLERNEKPKYVNGKLTMPEYVIGQEKANRKERKEMPSGGLSCDALSLDHLNEEDTETNRVENEDNLVKSDNSISEKEVEKVHFKKFKRKGGTRKRDDHSDE